MKLCEDVVTVFTQSVDPATRSPSYAPTVVSGASWYATQADTVDPKGGLAAARKVVVRIPAEAMPEGLAIKGGDIIVRGVEGRADLTPAAIRAEHSESMTVLAVTDNLRAPRGAHVKAVGS